MIPFNDLRPQFQSLREEILAAVDAVIESQSFIQGSFVEKFSAAFLKLHGGTYGTGCSNGTSAITLALRALEIGNGDEVLVPNNTFIGTAEPVWEVGAKPILVDIEPENYGMDLRHLESLISSKTKAIIPVHLFGNPVDMAGILSLATKYDLKVIEDCAQAHLAAVNGTPVGTLGHAATFSFYPGKNLGAIGDAGFVMSESESVYQQMRLLIDHGRREKYLHDILGGNYRMDGIQAAVLSVKLNHLEAWTNSRIRIAKTYDKALQLLGFKTLRPIQNAKCVYHIYPVEVSNREDILAHFKKREIQTGIHYPIPLSCQPAFEFLGYKKGQFPISEKIASRMMSLPMYPELSENQVATVMQEFIEVAKP